MMAATQQAIAAMMRDINGRNPKDCFPPTRGGDAQQTQTTTLQEKGADFVGSSLFLGPKSWFEALLNFVSQGVAIDNYSSSWESQATAATTSESQDQSQLKITDASTQTTCPTATAQKTSTAPALLNLSSQSSVEYSEKLMERLVLVADGIKDDCPALMLSQELLNSVRDVVSGAREVRNARFKQDHSLEKHGAWLEDLWSEQKSLTQDYEILADRGMKQPPNDLFEIMGQIALRLERVENAIQSVKDAYQQDREPLKVLEAEQLVRCNRLSVLLEKTLCEAQDLAEAQQPQPEDPQPPFDTYLLGTHQRFVEVTEGNGICDLSITEEPCVEVDPHDLRGWGNLLGPREPIQEEVFRSIDNVARFQKAVDDFRAWERDNRKEAWIESSPNDETETAFERRMDEVDVDMMDSVRERQAELDIAQRRAAFCGLKLDSEGKEVNDDSDELYVSPEEVERKNKSMVKWAEKVEPLGEEGPGMDEQDTEVPELEEWDDRPDDPFESLSERDEADWQAYMANYPEPGFDDDLFPDEEETDDILQAEVDEPKVPDDDDGEAEAAGESTSAEVDESQAPEQDSPEDSEMTEDILPEVEDELQRLEIEQDEEDEFFEDVLDDDEDQPKIEGEAPQYEYGGPDHTINDNIAHYLGKPCNICPEAPTVDFDEERPLGHDDQFDAELPQPEEGLQDFENDENDAEYPEDVQDLEESEPDDNEGLEEDTVQEAEPHIDEADLASDEAEDVESPIGIPVGDENSSSQRGSIGETF